MREEPVRIVVRVQPNASQSEVLRFKDGVWYIRVAAPPVKGKANDALIKFLSGILGVSRGNLTIEKGATGKRKVIGINGLTQNQVTEQLERRSKTE